MTDTPTTHGLRRLTPLQDCAIRQDLDLLGSASMLAERYGVSVRTIYRAAARAGETTRRVTVAGWWATFRLTDEGPTQITMWHPTKEALDAWPD